MTHTVGIFAFDAIEALDFAGPYEVFTTASRMQARIDADAPPLFDVFTVGRTASPLRVRAGLGVFPEHDFSHHPRVDVLIIPGRVVTAALARPEAPTCVPRSQRW